MLEFLNNKFINSSKKIKIELYLLTLLIFISLYLFFIENKNSTPVKSFKSQEYLDFENKKFTGSFLEIFSLIEEIAKENNIFIISNKKEENSVLLKIKANKKTILDFIKAVENINNFTQITTFILNKNYETNEYFFDVIIDMNRYFIKKFSKINKKKKIENIKNENKTFFINAIIDDYVLINNNWIKKGESIENFELFKIERNFVILKNNNQEIKLELLNENYLKKIN